MKTCRECGKRFDPRESLGSDFGQCQDCWEAQCSRSWWAETKRLDEVYGPIGRQA